MYVFAFSIFTSDACTLLPLAHCSDKITWYHISFCSFSLSSASSIDYSGGTNNMWKVRRKWGKKDVEHFVTIVRHRGDKESVLSLYRPCVCDNISVWFHVSMYPKCEMRKDKAHTLRYWKKAGAIEIVVALEGQYLIEKMVQSMDSNSLSQEWINYTFKW